jgi:hypothetical protein
MHVSARRALPFIVLLRLSLAVSIALGASAQAIVETNPTAAAPAARTDLATKPAPAKVDKALRERAAQFLQYTVDRSYSKAYELVAPETKDWYLSSGKPQYKAFKIESIEYSKDYREATVHSRVTRVLSMNGREVSTELVVADLWKFEAGKWMWYHDPNVLVTPFGEIKIDRSKISANPGAPPIPRDTSPAAAQEAAAKIDLDASTSKKELFFEEGKPGSDDFVFHNGLPGVVDVLVDIVGNYRDFSVEPKHVQLEGGKDLTVKVDYKPSSNSSPAFVRLTIQPFERTVQIPLKFKNAAP